MSPKMSSCVIIILFFDGLFYSSILHAHEMEPDFYMKENADQICFCADVQQIPLYSGIKKDNLKKKYKKLD